MMPVMFGPTRLRVVEIAVRGEIDIEVELIGEEHIGQLHPPGDEMAVAALRDDRLHFAVADIERIDVIDGARQPDAERVGMIAEHRGENVPADVIV